MYGGSWMSIVNGFGGMRTYDGILRFQPILPDKWDSYSFKIKFKGRQLAVRVEKEGTRRTNYCQEMR